MHTELKNLHQDFRHLGDPEIAENLQRYFKTGKGEYGEGDCFIGIRVPVIRTQAKKYAGLALNDVHELLTSRIHEERLCALLILVYRFERVTPAEQRKIYQLYLRNTRYINNWDLVDLSAPKIVGKYLRERNKDNLYKLCASSNVWERRIAVLATFDFIGQGEFAEALHVASLLLADEHDLIHKAVGWMLREIGKRNSAVEKEFLKSDYQKMPRTMLRYAIERFPDEERKKYLAGDY